MAPLEPVRARLRKLVPSFRRGQQRRTSRSHRGRRSGAPTPVETPRSPVSAPRPAQTEFMRSREFSYSTPRKRFVKRIVACGVGFIFVALPVVAALFLWRRENMPFRETLSGDYCRLLEAEGSKPWSNFFTPTMSWGKLSYTHVRVIDTAWDFLVARVGTFLLAWIGYRTILKTVCWIAEESPVSYELFQSSTFSWPSIRSLLPQVRAVFSRSTILHRLCFFAIALNILYTAVFPLLANMSTGYIPERETQVKLLNSTAYEPLESLVNNTVRGFSVIPNGQHRRFLLVPKETEEYFTVPNASDLMIGNVSVDYVYRYIDKKFDFDQTGDFQRGSWPDSRDKAFPDLPPIDFHSTKLVFVVPPDFTNQYSLDYASNPDNILCVNGSTFRWGFSPPATSLLIALHCIWLLNTVFLWAISDRRSVLWRANRQLGPYRAAVDMVESMMEDLGLNLCTYSDQDLERELRKRQVKVKYYAEQPGVSGERSPHVGLSSHHDKTKLQLQVGQAYG